MDCGSCGNKNIKPNKVTIVDVKKVAQVVPIKNVKITVKKIN